MKPIFKEKIHHQVLGECLDIPQQVPVSPIMLTDVGITGKTVWVQLPQGRIPFDAKLYVSLQSSVRGIHMSRMEEVISELHDQDFEDLVEYGRKLAMDMVRRQEAQQGKVVLSGKLPVQRSGIVSKKTSIDSVDISAHIQVNMENTNCPVQSKVGATVHHITACPCTQAYNQVLFQAGDDLPLPTHSQRSLTSLVLEVHEGRPRYDELIKCLETALHVTQDLLKRQDEAEIVMKSHRFPQFAEDAVRETARVAAERFHAVLPPGTAIEVESLSLESIHIHDVHCRLQGTLAEIKSQLER